MNSDTISTQKSKLLSDNIQLSYKHIIFLPFSRRRQTW